MIGSELVTDHREDRVRGGDLHPFGDAAGAGVERAAMEASSHGLDQRRLDGVQLVAAGFTNFTQDHLDYHGDMPAYFTAKRRLFAELVESVRVPRGAGAAQDH